MPFLAQKHLRVPTKDLLSWMFDEQNYDRDMPVSRQELLQIRLEREKEYV
jgi:hypothetical protein